MKIAMFCRYSELGASSRLRFFQFVPFLEKAGLEVDRFSFFDDEYLQNLYHGQGRNFWSTVKFYRRRFREMRDLPDGIPVMIEYELLPYLPYCCEEKFLKKHPYILNFDDAVDLKYASKPLLKNKFPQLLSHAAGVIAANDMLLEKFSRFNSNILKLPTIPPAAIIPGENKPEKLTLVWTGTPVTVKFLLERGEALRQAAGQTDFELLIVGGGTAVPGVNCRLIPRSEENEAAALKQAHAGIMPLPDTPFARGKSAYKLICYLRAGIPGIASPVGENCRVIRHDENGFLAESDQNWVDAITAMADPALRNKLADGAAEDALKYDLPANAALLKGFIDRTFLKVTSE
jgi:glycosyltransferase involved in cell wall biosynthesis